MHMYLRINKIGYATTANDGRPGVFVTIFIAYGGDMNRPMRLRYLTPLSRSCIRRAKSKRCL